MDLFLSPFAPTIAAFIVVAFIGGTTGLRAWADRFKLWRGVGWRQGVGVWLLCYAAFFTIVCWVLIGMVGTGDNQALATTFTAYGGAPYLVVASLIYGMFLSVGPLLEEMGWRGFALPILLERHTPLVASIVLGALWAAWHLPREIPVLLSGDVARVLAKQVTFFTGTICTSIIATYLYFKLGGSAWSGIIAHAMHNETSVNFMRQWKPGFALGPINIEMLLLIEMVGAA